MFGLMRNRCNAENKEHYRLHYCGTCKTMGSLYGQSIRMSLNFDMVFLGELLSALQQDEGADWQANYHHKSCFKLPNNTENQPFALQYAATVNVLFAGLKVDDNIKDSPFFLWKALQWLVNPALKKAEKQLEKWEIDTNFFWEKVKNQHVLEQSNQQLTLAILAKPTAEMTAYVFSKAAHLIDKAKEAEVLYKLGYAYGELIYLLDAYQDFQEDIRKKRFNAIANAFSTQELNFHIKQKLEAQLQKLSTEIISSFQSLSLSESVIRLFVSRFSLNFHSQLSQISASSQELRPFSLKTAFMGRLENAKANAEKWFPLQNAPHYALKSNALIFAAMLAPQLPHHLASALSEKHNLSMWAIFTAIPVAMWAGRKAKKTCKNTISAANHSQHTLAFLDPCTDVLSCCSCVGSCCEGIGTCCDSIEWCGNCMKGLSSGDSTERTCSWLTLVFMLVLLIAVIVALIVVLV